jgi:hypothetical protein
MPALFNPSISPFMPLSSSINRELLHIRSIDLRGYRRDDGLYDIEAHMVDTKTHPIRRGDDEALTPAGMPLHDMWVRLVVDEHLVVKDVNASTEASPFPICGEATTTLRSIVGERIQPGWTQLVKSKLGGVKSCTHLMELLIPLATVAFQALVAVRASRPEAEDSTGRPRKIDSCYAYSSERIVVQRRWPAFYRAPKVLDSKAPSA